MTSMISYIIHDNHLRMSLSLSPSHLTIIYLEDSEKKNHTLSTSQRLKLVCKNLARLLF